MSSPEVILDEIERDALTELVNIGVSRAATALRKMVGQQVLLSVPAVDVIDYAKAAALLGERENEELVAVRQGFSGAFSGDAMLIFPQAVSLELVRAVVGPEVEPAEIAAFEAEALAETGNIILNGCLASMANMLQQTLTMSLPEVVRTNGIGLFAPERRATDDGLVLFLYINFFLRDRDIRGYIAMLMDLQSLASLKRLIAEFISRVMDDDDADGPAHRPG